MPRKAIPRAFKLVCKHYKGFDRHFATKAIATRKLQTSQGVYVNHKLAATPDYKYGKGTGRPLVRSHSTSYPSFAAQPVAARTRQASTLSGFQDAQGSMGQPAAPSFAATPVWTGQQRSSQQPSTSCTSDTTMADSSMRSAASDASQLSADPLYQFACMGQQPTTDLRPRRTSPRKQERAALKWYGSLDRRPVSKVSAHPSGPPSSRRSSGSGAQIVAALHAYADLDGRRL